MRTWLLFATMVNALCCVLLLRETNNLLAKILEALS